MCKTFFAGEMRACVNYVRGIRMAATRECSAHAMQKYLPSAFIRNCCDISTKQCDEGISAVERWMPEGNVIPSINLKHSKGPTLCSAGVRKMNLAFTFWLRTFLMLLDQEQQTWP